MEVEPEDGQDEQGGQQWQHPARDDSEGDLQSGHEGYESRPVGGINPIRTTPSRDRTLGHGDCRSRQRSSVTTMRRLLPTTPRPTPDSPRKHSQAASLIAVAGYPCPAV